MATVLIVDDHASFRASARDLLEEEGFEVIGEASDGATALAAARKLCPDVVLLDIQLPDMNGIAVAAKLASEGDRAKILLVSSRDAFEFGSLLSESFAAGFLPKEQLTGENVRRILG
jgi:DNA-binding NarL/FixJ family response regulator